MLESSAYIARKIDMVSFMSVRNDPSMTAMYSQTASCPLSHNMPATHALSNGGKSEDGGKTQDFNQYLIQLKKK